MVQRLRRQGLVKILLLLWFATASTGLLASESTPLQPAPAADVRILIDISGSMKKNDPDNLRKPAVKLITRLLPDGSEAGIWTFGQYVNALVPHGPVDSAWREGALSKAEEISSVALHTNIGGALETAYRDLTEEADWDHTHFILLTDGVVDISRDSAANVDERERILSEVLTRIRDRGARLHTIALSRNADLSLLDRLALDTGGLATLAESPEQLTRVFLSTFEQAAPAEEVPLVGNTFFMDSSIEEFTALIFRNADDPGELALIQPDGSRLDAGTESEELNWYSDQGYELITVKRPYEGEWQIEGELGAGSRVTVVSQLRLVVDPVPAAFFAGEALQFRAGLFEDGQLITKPDFLQVVTMTQSLAGPEGFEAPAEQLLLPLQGLYTGSYADLSDVGVYEVSLLADGKTFKRQTRLRSELKAPVSLELQSTGSGPNSQYRLVARILSPALPAAQSSVQARVREPDGTRRIEAFRFDEAGDEFTLLIEPRKGDGDYEVTAHFASTLANGNSFKYRPEPIIATFPRQEAAPNAFENLISEADTEAMHEDLMTPAEPVTESAEPAATVPDTAVTAPPQTEAPPETQRTEEVDWIFWAVVGGSALGGLTLIGLLVWILRRRKKPKENTAAETPEQKGDSSAEAETQEAPVKPEAVAGATLAGAALAEAAAGSSMDLEQQIEALEEAEQTAQEDIQEEEEEEPPLQALEEESPAATDDPLPDLEAEEPELQELVEDADLEVAESSTEPESPESPAAAPADEADEDEFNLEDFDISDVSDLSDDEDEDEPKA